MPVGFTVPCAEHHFVERLLAYIRQKKAGGLFFQAQELYPTDHAYILTRFKAEHNEPNEAQKSDSDES
jgi:hypothetical protein